MLDPKQTHVHAQWKYTAPLIACRIHPKGDYVYSSAENYRLQRWEFTTGKFVEWEAHDGWVRDLVVTPDGETLISAGTDDHIAFWPARAEKPEATRTVKAHDGWVRALALSPDAKLLATAGNDRLVKLWNVADGKLVREFLGHDSHVYSVLFHPDGKLLLSGDLSGVVRIWEVQTGKEVGTLDAKELHTYNSGQQVHYGGVRSMTFDAKRKHLYCCGLHKATNPLGAVNEPLLLDFDWNERKKLRSMLTTGARSIGWRVVPLSDGTILVASGGSGGGFLHFWKPGEEKQFHQFKTPNTVRAMDVHPDGLHVATADADRQLRVHRLAAKEG